MAVRSAQPDITNRGLFKRVSIEWFAGIVMGAIGFIFTLGVIYSAFGKDILANKEGVAAISKKQSEQSREMDLIRASMTNLNANLNSLESQIKAQNERQNEKMDLMLKILQGDFDQRKTR